MKRKGIVIGIALLVVVGVIGFIAADSAKQTTKTNSGSASHTTTQTKTTPTTSNGSSTQATAGQAAAPSSSPAAKTGVIIKNYMFDPMDIKVKVGDTVTWTNQDTVQHSVVSDTASADLPNGPLLSKGETYSFTFQKVGTYSIHCGPHPYMKATITVSE